MQFIGKYENPYTTQIKSTYAPITMRKQRCRDRKERTKKISTLKGIILDIDSNCVLAAFHISK